MKLKVGRETTFINKEWLGSSIHTKWSPAPLPCLEIKKYFSTSSCREEENVDRCTYYTLYCIGL